MSALTRLSGAARGAWNGARMGMSVAGPGHAPRVEPAYEAAGQGRRVSHWLASSAGINALVGWAGGLLRARARQLRRNDTWTRRAVSSLTANWVGTGIVPDSQHPDPAVRDGIDRMWRDWAERSDFQRQTTFYGQQTQAVKSMLIAGEAMARFRPVDPAEARILGLPVPLQLQLLAPDHLPLEDNRVLPNGRRVVSGVELDADGRPSAYWLLPQHPGEAPFLLSANSSVRFPVTEILHLFEPEEIGQLRGITRGTAALLPARDLHDYRDAERVRKKVAAAFTVFWKRGRGAGQSPLLNAPTARAGKPDASGFQDVVLEPGTIQMLEQGDEIETAAPADVGGSFEAFVRHELLSLAAGWCLPEHKLSGDLSRANFSSLRAGDTELQREAAPMQHQVIVPRLGQPVWDRVMVEAVVSGALDAYVPGGVALYLDNPRQFHKARWMPQGHRYTDPLKEVTADVIAVRGGVKSRSQVIAERGRDAETVDKEIAADNIRADQLGLVFDSDPRRVNRGGAVQATEVAESGQSENARDSAAA